MTQNAQKRPSRRAFSLSGRRDLNLGPLVPQVTTAPSTATGCATAWRRPLETSWKPQVATDGEIGKRPSPAKWSICSESLTSSDWRRALPSNRWLPCRAPSRAAGASSARRASTFTVDAHQETSTAITYSTGWGRYAWSSAYGGYENRSSTTGASARLNFTGRSVAWVAPTATNRGQAYVYVDGGYAGTLDLYSASTLVRKVVYSRNWSSSAAHPSRSGSREPRGGRPSTSPPSSSFADRNRTGVERAPRGGARSCQRHRRAA